MQEETGRIFHVWCRGVDGRSIFLDTKDHERFFRILNFFNNTTPVEMRLLKNTEVALPDGEPLVGILAHTELDNHFHLLLQEQRKGGLTTFLRKIGTGYTHYFNRRHKRRGRLFESRQQYKPIHSDQQLLHILAYIHLNILDRRNKKWRDGEMHLASKKVQQLLLRYPWSSARAFLTSLGNDPLLDLESIQQLFSEDDIRGHKNYLYEWIRRGVPTEVQLP